MKKLSEKTKQSLKTRNKVEWAILIALLIIIYLLLAGRFQWWPWSQPNTDLGTAFYVLTKKDNSTGNTASGNGGSSGGGTTSGGGSGGSNTGGGNSGGGGGTSATTSPLIRFAAGINTGTTKEDISAQSNGISQDCALLVNSSSAGKQEVCVYTEGNKIITVTYLNDRVISASRSGF